MVDNIILMTCSDKIKPKHNCQKPDVYVPISWLEMELKCEGCGSLLVSPEIHNHEQNIKNIFNS